MILQFTLSVFMWVSLLSVEKLYFFVVITFDSYSVLVYSISFRMFQYILCNPQTVFIRDREWMLRRSSITTIN